MKFIKWFVVLTIIIAIIKFVFAFSWYLVPIGVLSFILYRSWKVKILKRSQADIDKFILSYFPSNVLWPSNIDIPEDDIKALQSILKENDISIPLNILKKIVINSAIKEMDNKFEKSFYHVNNKLSEKPSVKDWAVAYVLTFGNNLENIDLLYRLAKRHGTFVTKTSLKTSIESEINKQSHIRKVQKIKESMKSEKKREMITIEQIDAMNGYDFEHFLSNLFSSFGYSCSVTKASGDQGADVILEKFGERTVVQAKRYKGSVSNSAIQEVVAAKAHYECSYAMVVTSGYFTRSAVELAKSNKVKLYDRAALKELLNQC